MCCGGRFDVARAGKSEATHAVSVRCCGDYERKVAGHAASMQQDTRS